MSPNLRHLPRLRNKPRNTRRTHRIRCMLSSTRTSRRTTTTYPTTQCRRTVSRTSKLSLSSRASCSLLGIALRRMVWRRSRVRRSLAGRCSRSHTPPGLWGKHLLRRPPDIPTVCPTRRLFKRRLPGYRRATGLPRRHQIHRRLHPVRIMPPDLCIHLSRSLRSIPRMSSRRTLRL